ncbi:uncharacterized protein LOC144104058 [Amblyomma americanum]
MSERGASYVLVGFSKEIDFRPLRFVKPLPENRICSVCRYVPKTTFFLPCCHVLCEPCYEKCKARGEACALDAQGCPEEEVECRTLSPEKILGKQVSCWNRRNGCEAVNDVSTILKHFHTNCGFHSARCPKCAAHILRRDLIAHLKSQCSEQVLLKNYSAACNATLAREQYLIKVSLRGIKDGLQKVSEECVFQRASVTQVSTAHRRSLMLISHDAAALEEIRKGVEKVLNALEGINEIHDHQEDETEKLRDILEETIKELRMTFVAMATLHVTDIESFDRLGADTKNVLFDALEGYLAMAALFRSCQCCVLI